MSGRIWAAVGLVLLSGGLVFLAADRGGQGRLTPQLPVPQLGLEEAANFIYTGSVGYWWSEEGLEVLQANIQKLDTINLYLYGLESDGRVVLGEVVKPATEASLLALAHENERKIMLGINNFGEPDRLDRLLREPAVLADHRQQILELVEAKKYDGVAIDYENLDDDQTALFTAYIQGLGQALRARNKELVVTTLVDVRGRVWDGIDVAAVAKAADRLELQTYLQHSPETKPGPVAPVAWVDSVLRAASAAGIPTEKIIFGAAFTGNDWMLTGERDFDSRPAREALARLQAAGVRPRWDNEARAYTYVYEDGAGEAHVAWVEEARSVREKIRRFKPRGAGGIFLWFLSGEDPQIWDPANGIFTE